MVGRGVVGGGVGVVGDDVGFGFGVVGWELVGPDLVGPDLVGSDLVAVEEDGARVRGCVADVVGRGAGVDTDGGMEDEALADVVGRGSVGLVDDGCPRGSGPGPPQAARSRLAARLAAANQRDRGRWSVAMAPSSYSSS